MDAWGYPLSLFTTNRWVTGETWRHAEDAITLLRHFEIDHAFPSWPTNRWITAMLRLHRPFIEGMLHHRDAVVTAWRAMHPEGDVFEDRRLDIIGTLPVSVEHLATRLAASIGSVERHGAFDRIGPTEAHASP